MQNMLARSRVRVDVEKVERPGRLDRSPNERHKKVTDDLSLLVMRGEVVSIVSKSEDLFLHQVL